jgi:hypothetical protein
VVQPFSRSLLPGAVLVAAAGAWLLSSQGAAAEPVCAQPRVATLTARQVTHGDRMRISLRATATVADGGVTGLYVDVGRGSHVVMDPVNAARSTTFSAVLRVAERRRYLVVARAESLQPGTDCGLMLSARRRTHVTVR